MDTVSSSKSTTILIPAAGWGSRMGLPNSKEVLIHPVYQIPYIQYAIESVQSMQAAIKILTRPEKTDLIGWFSQYRKIHNDLDIEVLYVKDSKEWPETLLQSEHVWSQYNLVLLPDTDWNPKNAPLFVRESLGSVPVVYGVFMTERLNWGFVHIQDGLLSLVEKPTAIDKNFQAWGIMGFQRDVGRTLLNAHLESTWDHSKKYLNISAKAILLDEFNDRTRGEQSNA